MDGLAVAGGDPEEQDEQGQTAEGDDTLDTGAVLVALTDDGSQDQGNGPDTIANDLADAEGNLADSTGAGSPDGIGTLGKEVLGGVGRDEVQGDTGISDRQDRDGAALVKNNGDNQESYARKK